MATIIKNVRVFDGKEIMENQTVTIKDGLLSEAAEGHVIDASGHTLLPGLIDSHIHLYEDLKYLKMAVSCGITTMLDMGIRTPAAVDRQRNIPGLTNVFSSCGLIFAPGSKAAGMMNFPEDMAVKDVEDAERIVSSHILQGADFIKLILEEKGRNNGVDFPLEVGRAVVEQAHRHGKKVIAHAVTNKTYEMGINIGVDVLTHIPFTKPLSEGLAEVIANRGIVVVPTLIMGKGLMEKIVREHPYVAKLKTALDKFKNGRDAFNFKIDMACRSLEKLRQANVPIFAGTDSNMDDTTTQASVPYGKALQDELVLLVKSGMSPQEALTAATSAPAEYFGFHDRGQIVPGMRADLLLVEGNPVLNIEDIRKVKRVWVQGKEVNLDGIS